MSVLKRRCREEERLSLPSHMRYPLQMLLLGQKCEPLVFVKPLVVIATKMDKYGVSLILFPAFPSLRSGQTWPSSSLTLENRTPHQCSGGIALDPWSPCKKPKATMIGGSLFT